MEIVRCEQLTDARRDTGSKEYGKEAVLSAWYDEYGTAILRYCFMFLGNRSDAEDATQENIMALILQSGRGA